MTHRSKHLNLTFYPLKVQTLAEASPQKNHLLQDLRQRSLDTPDWSLDQLWLIAVDHHVEGQFMPALRYYQRLLEWSEHEPTLYGEALEAVGHVMLLLNKTADALPVFERAIKLAPQALRSPFFLAKCYQQQRQDQKMADALESFLRGYSAQDMLVAEAFSLLAKTYERLGDTAKARQTLAAGATRLKSWGFWILAQHYVPLLPEVESPPASTEVLDLTSSPHFFGPELEEWFPYRRVYTQPEPLVALEAAAAPLAEAVSDSFQKHPSAVNKGPLDPRRQIVVIGDFSLGESSLYHELIIELARRHGVTVICAGQVPPLFRQEEWMSLYPCINSLPHLREAVLSQRPEILMYVGLGPKSPHLYALATQQMAPTQALLGAYPISSGLKTMQYFLSFDWLELPEADSHYTESLVRLAGMPIRALSLPDQFIPREAFNLPLDRRTYLCPVSPSVHHQAFAGILAHLLAEDPDGQILMPGYGVSALDAAYFERFRQAHGALAERLFFLPALDEIGLLSLIREADVLLDPVHAGIIHPSWRLLKLGTPMVTWASPYARGRYASSLYQQLNLTDSIAPDLASYATTALDLALVPEQKQRYRETAQHQAAPLFDFETCLASLEAFLSTVLSGN